LAHILVLAVVDCVVQFGFRLPAVRFSRLLFFHVDCVSEINSLDLTELKSQRLGDFRQQIQVLKGRQC